MWAKYPHLTNQTKIETANDLVNALIQCITQPKIYRHLIDQIDYDKYGVYGFTAWDGRTNEWRIPLTSGTTWVLTVRAEQEKVARFTEPSGHPVVPDTTGQGIEVEDA